MENGKSKRKIRTIGINFPFTREGDFLYKCLKVTKDQEDRSMSNVIFRILREHFDKTTDNFKEHVYDEIELDTKASALKEVIESESDDGVGSALD
jgi:hypothetical protein